MEDSAKQGSEGGDGCPVMVHRTISSSPSDAGRSRDHVREMMMEARGGLEGTREVRGPKARQTTRTPSDDGNQNLTLEFKAQGMHEGTGKASVRSSLDRDPWKSISASEPN